MTNNVLSHLLVASFQGGLFVAAVWLLCRLLKRLPAGWKCWLWRLTSAKFLVGLALAATIPIVVSTPVRNSPIVSAVQRAQTLPEIDLPVMPRKVPSFYDRLLGMAGSGRFSQSPARPAETVTIRSEAPPQPVLNVRKWLLALWLLGMIFMALRALVAWRKVAGLLEPANSEPAESRFGGLLASSRIRRKVSVRVVDNLSAPALLGLVGPAIAIPRDSESASDGAVHSAVAHEMAHLKRNDIAWMLLAEGVKAVFWFHPLAWLSCREQRIESEIAADDLAQKWTKTPTKAYAVHLLEWVDPTIRTGKALPIAPGALSATHELTRRVKEMSQFRYRRGVAATVGSLIVFPLAAGLAPITLVAASQGLLDTPWPKFQGSVANSGIGHGAPSTGHQIWKVETDSGVESAPTIGPDKTVYFGADNGFLYAVDGATGKRRWAFKTENKITSSAAVGANGDLYVGSHDGNVYAVSAKTGRKQWLFATAGVVCSSPAIGCDGTVYVGSWDGSFYALDGRTGAKKWIFPTGGPVTSSPAIGPDGTVYIGSRDDGLYALDGVTGIKRWSFSAGGHMGSPAIGPDGTVYAGSWDGKLYALDGASGAKKWEYQTGAEITSCPAIGANGMVCVGSNDQQIYGIDCTTGVQKWAFATEGPIDASPVVGSDGTVYIGSDAGKFYALVGETGWMKWHLDPGDRLDSPAAIGSDGTLYFGGAGGEVFAVH